MQTFGHMRIFSVNTPDLALSHQLNCSHKQKFSPVEPKLVHATCHCMHIDYYWQLIFIFLNEWICKDVHSVENSPDQTPGLASLVSPCPPPPPARRTLVRCTPRGAWTGPLRYKASGGGRCSRHLLAAWRSARPAERSATRGAPGSDSELKVNAHLDLDARTFFALTSRFRCGVLNAGTSGVAARFPGRSGDSGSSVLGVARVQWLTFDFLILNPGVHIMGGSGDSRSSADGNKTKHLLFQCFLFHQL